ncbi:hypothetical protein PYCC9005_005763 [Savitreella phatthalungensis]
MTRITLEPELPMSTEPEAQDHEHKLQDGDPQMVAEGEEIPAVGKLSLMDRYLEEQRERALPRRTVRSVSGVAVAELLRGPSDASALGVSVTAPREVVREKYPAKAHLRKVASFLPAEPQRKSNYLLLEGAKVLPRGTSDQTLPFEQESNFYYLTGNNQHPDWWLLYDIPNDKACVFIPPQRAGRDIAYLGQLPSREEVLAAYDVDVVNVLDELGGVLVGRLGGSGFYGIGDDVVREALTWSRVVKDEVEKASLRRASRISAHAHISVATHLRAYRTELEAETQFVASCRARKADGQPPYAPIVAAGTNAAVLHYSANNASFTNPNHTRQLLLIDAAAQSNRYASDLTRTYPLPLDGRFTDKGGAVYRVVLEAQKWALSRVRAGVRMSDLQKGVHREVLAPAVVELGLVNADIETTRSKYLTAAFMMHGLGHHIGLDVHDVTPLRRVHTKSLPADVDTAHTGDPLELALFRAATTARTTARGVLGDAVVDGEEGWRWEEVALERDMCVTVEPGMYFNREFLSLFRGDTPARSSDGANRPGSAVRRTFEPQPPPIAKLFNWHAIDTYMHVGGVRIEDTVIVTDHGYENLTDAVPRELEEVEALVRGDR